MPAPRLHLNAKNGIKAAEPNVAVSGYSRQNKSNAVAGRKRR